MKLQNKFIIKSIVYSSLSLVIYYSPITYAGVEQFCEPNLAINDKNLNGCSNLPVLYPANDSQTNMTLLLSDLGRATIKPMTADANLWDAVYGTVPFDAANLSSLTQNKLPNQRKRLERNDTVFDERCTSFDSGNQTFNTQVQNNKAIPNLEKQILISERKKMNQCGDKIELIAINPNWSITTRQYASYLNAGILFYNSNYSAATKIYTVLTNVEDTWLKETSQYMLGLVEN